MKSHTGLTRLILLAVALCAAALLPATAQAAELTVSWDDNSDSETGFAIERAPADAAATFTEVGRVAANVSTFKDTTLAGGTLYQFRVRAFNAGGFSAYSNTANGTTLPNPPAAPGNNKVTAPPAIATVSIPSGTALLVIAEAKQ